MPEPVDPRVTTWANAHRKLQAARAEWRAARAECTEWGYLPGYGPRPLSERGIAATAALSWAESCERAAALALRDDEDDDDGEGVAL